ncbi:hypothetical protein AK812_SmicGene26474 [Symbiodinium microadriaticum]|uniref:Reverse transcriptase domain-containing protein n=1 Tax=Symbiodinium microadriaticum TaxID=2951 RepID=A0A1Q9D9A0_SYMMI|nr:hypothetical protein AK812_SmicGene26474 [Symbiodinium microadriaticum]
MVVQQLPSVEKNERFYKPGCGPAGLLSSACVRKWGEEMHVRVMLDRSVLLLVSMSEEFTDAALGLDHPFDALDALDDDCKRMLFDCAVKGPSWMCQQRAATLSKWLAWTNELQVDKEKLHDSMEQDLGWVDVNLFEKIKDKIDLRALDVIISMTRAWVRIMSTEVLTTVDLKAAYKQYAIHPTHRAFNLVALMTPEGDECKLFEGRALPFGATSSVIHFNRVSRLLWRIGIALMLPWGNFYDDFPVMSPKIVADNTMCTMKTLMQLLGVKCSLDKLREFSVKASVLGIEIDVGGAANGWVHVRNKEGRADETVAAVKEALLAGSLSRRGFARVAGRVQFADAQVMGRSSGDLVIDARAANLYNILIDRLMRHQEESIKALSIKEAAQELIDDFKTNYPGPTTQELLAADRKIWGAIGTLVSAGWSLDEALYEEEGGLPGQEGNAAADTGQPFRLELMQALAKLIEDPDQDLPSILAEGLEVCQGNWRPAEEDPETVAALLADEEAAGSDYAYGPRSTQIISASSLLLFAFNGTLWRYVVCHFGAKFSAYWWQRVGGLITRILHASLAQYPHRAWLYVDDLLAALLRTSAHESLLIIVLLLSCLGAPISWKKASVGDSLIWCGWKFNFAYETVELCAAKRLKLSSQIQGLLSKPKVQRKDLEACIGLLMWVSHVAGAHNEWADDLSRGTTPAYAYESKPRLSLGPLALCEVQASDPTLPRKFELAQDQSHAPGTPDYIDDLGMR